LAKEFGHVDKDGKMKVLFFTKYTSQADKIQKKRGKEQKKVQEEKGLLRKC